MRVMSTNDPNSLQDYAGQLLSCMSSVISQLAKFKEILSLHICHLGRPAVPAVIAGMRVTEEVSAIARQVATRKDRGLVSNMR